MQCRGRVQVGINGCRGASGGGRARCVLLGTGTSLDSGAWRCHSRTAELPRGPQHRGPQGGARADSLCAVACVRTRTESPHTQARTPRSPPPLHAGWSHRLTLLWLGLCFLPVALPIVHTVGTQSQVTSMVSVGAPSQVWKLNICVPRPLRGPCPCVGNKPFFPCNVSNTRLYLHVLPLSGHRNL
jgi:hypothetical protein